MRRVPFLFYACFKVRLGAILNQNQIELNQSVLKKNGPTRFYSLKKYGPINYYRFVRRKEHENTACDLYNELYAFVSEHRVQLIR